MKFFVLIAALLMPGFSWLSQRQAFGPDNATLSDRYPTLLVAAGYAFAIWGLIFALDLVFALWQVKSQRAERGPVAAIRKWAALGFALTAAWMVVFAMQLFWLALLVIWGALAALVMANLKLARADSTLTAADFWLAVLPLSLHAGWLSLAVFLNTAQVVVAYELLSGTNQLPWSLFLWAGAGGLLLWVNARLRRGGVPYVLAAVWGLVGAFVEQSRSVLAGSDVSAWVAGFLALVLLLQTLFLNRQASRRDQRPAPVVLSARGVGE